MTKLYAYGSESYLLPTTKKKKKKMTTKQL